MSVLSVSVLRNLTGLAVAQCSSPPCWAGVSLWVLTLGMLDFQAQNDSCQQVSGASSTEWGEKHVEWGNRRILGNSSFFVCFFSLSSEPRQHPQGKDDSTVIERKTAKVAI